MKMVMMEDDNDGDVHVPAGMYPLSAINRRLVEIIGACYSNGGLIGNRVAVYAPYSSTDMLCRTNSQVRRESGSRRWQR